MEEWEEEPVEKPHSFFAPGYCSTCVDMALEYLSLCSLIMNDQDMTYNRKEDDYLAMLQLDGVSDFVDRLRGLIEEAQESEQGNED